MSLNDDVYTRNMEYHPVYNNPGDIPPRVAAFGALACLLADSIDGAEYSAEPPTEDAVVFVLRLPVWMDLQKLSGQSQVSLSALRRHAAGVTEIQDGIYRTLRFTVNFREDSPA